MYNVLTSVKDGITLAPTSTPGGPSPPAPLHTAASVSVSVDPLTGTSSDVDQLRKVGCLKGQFSVISLPLPSQLGATDVSCFVLHFFFFYLVTEEISLARAGMPLASDPLGGTPLRPALCYLPPPRASPL